MADAAGILAAAQGHLADRAKTYDNPAGERSMPAAVAAFNIVIGRVDAKGNPTSKAGQPMTEEEGWLFQVILKAVRSQQGGYRADSYEDGSAYFALAGEAAAAHRGCGVRPAAAAGEAASAVDADEDGIPWSCGTCGRKDTCAPSQRDCGGSSWVPKAASAEADVGAKPKNCGTCLFEGNDLLKAPCLGCSYQDAKPNWTPAR